METIDKKKFYYFLEVLPPLVMGKKEVVCFLEHFDKNAEITKEITSGPEQFTDLFIQGEGCDNHPVYGCAKGGKYFFLGTTTRMWNTEDFRYPDTGNDMNQKISQKIGGDKK